MVKKPGYIIPNTAISVDYWYVKRKAYLRVHFLTHCHADHTDGLTNSWRRRIYCSPTTAKLAHCLYGIKPALFETIELDETRTIEYDDYGKGEKRSFQVTALDADHCPGAVMFLLDGWFGRILCTGDFRFEKDAGVIDIDRLRLLPIDRLYLDSTNSRIKELPKRSEAIADVLRIIASRPETETILLAMPQARLGKETLLVAVAERFDQKICVNEKRVAVARVLELDGYFTTDATQTRFHVVNSSMGKVSWRMMDFKAAGHSIFVLVLTSLQSWRAVVKPGEEGACRKLPFDESNTAVIPYSDHSSGMELEEFVNVLSFKQLFMTGDQNEAESTPELVMDQLNMMDSNSNNEISRMEDSHSCGLCCDCEIMQDFVHPSHPDLVKETKEAKEISQTGIMGVSGEMKETRPVPDLMKNIDEFLPLITYEENIVFTDREIDALALIEAMGP